MKKTTSLKNRRRQQRIADGSALALLLFLAFCVMLPIWWIFRSSLMTNAELFYWPPKFLPPNFWKYFGNTTTIIVPSVLGGTITATMGGYASARLRFKGKKFLFTLVVGSKFLPTMVTLIPLYIMWTRVFHLTDSFLLLIPPYFCGGGSFNIFLIRQFVSTIPRELDEAAICTKRSSFQLIGKLLLLIMSLPLPDNIADGRRDSKDNHFFASSIDFPALL